MNYSFLFYVLILSALIQSSKAVVPYIFGFDFQGLTYRSIDTSSGTFETVFTVPELSQRIYNEIPYIDDNLAIAIGQMDYVNKTPLVDFIDLKNQEVSKTIVYYDYDISLNYMYDHVVMDPTNQYFILFNPWNYGSILTVDVETLQVVPGTPNITLPKVQPKCYPDCYPTEAEYIFDYDHDIVYVYAMYTFYQLSQDDMEENLMKKEMFLQSLEELDEIDRQPKVIDASLLDQPLPCYKGGCIYMLTLSISNGTVLGAAQMGFWYTLQFIKVENSTSIITLYLAPYGQSYSTQIVRFNPTNANHRIMVSPPHLPVGASDPVIASIQQDVVYFIYQAPLPPKGADYGQFLGVFNISDHSFQSHRTCINTTYIYVPPN